MTIMYKLFRLPGSLKEIKEEQRITGEGVVVNLNAARNGRPLEKFVIEANIALRGTPLVSRIKIGELDPKRLQGKDSLDVVCEYSERLKKEEGINVSFTAINLYPR